MNVIALLLEYTTFKEEFEDDWSDDDKSVMNNYGADKSDEETLADIKMGNPTKALDKRTTITKTEIITEQFRDFDPANNDYIERGNDYRTRIGGLHDFENTFVTNPKCKYRKKMNKLNAEVRYFP